MPSDLERPLRVLLVDDHGLVRYGLRKLVEECPGFEVLDEVGTGEEAVARAPESDLVLLDLHLPGLGGIELLEKLVARGARVLVVSMHTDEVRVLKALRAGAAGYLSKVATAEEFREALELVRRGQVYLHSSLVSGMANQMRRPAGPELTAREREILEHLIRGKRITEVAEQMVLSQNTVKTHLKSLYRKFGVSDRTHLVLNALASGIAWQQ